MWLAWPYICLGLLIASVEVHRIRSGKGIDALLFFNGAYFVFFVFVPLNILAFGELAVRQKYAYQTWSHGDFWTALSLVLAYVAFVAGYRRRRCKVSTSRASEPLEYSGYARWLGIAFLVIGLLGLAYHANVVGGVVNALYLAPQVRAGEAGHNGNFLFIRQFAAFCATAFTLYWVSSLDASTSVQDGNSCRTIISYTLLAMLGAVFVYYALTTYGRREFLYPVLTCLVVWALSGSRRRWRSLLLLFGLSILWAACYYFFIPAAQLSMAGSTQQITISDLAPNLYFQTVQGLGDTFMHYVAAQHATLWQFGFLADLWEIPAQLVPSQILGFERSRGMFGETSEFILGRPLEPGLSGEEPLGLHGYLLVNFSYPGMFLIFYMAGKGYRLLDDCLRPAKDGVAMRWLLFTWAVLGALTYLREGVFILLLKQHISWWLAGGLLVWFARRKARSPKVPIHQHSTTTNI